MITQLIIGLQAIFAMSAFLVFHHIRLNTSMAYLYLIPPYCSLFLVHYYAE